MAVKPQTFSPFGAVALLAGIGAGLWLTYPVWGPEPCPGVDMIAHLTRVEYGVEHFVRHARLDGWYPLAYLGHPNFAIRGPGVTWLTALVQAASFDRLSTATAFKVVIFGAVALLPCCVAFAARSLGLGATGAAAAGILALAVANPAGNGITGLFGLGLVENQVATDFLFVALGALLRVADRADARWVVLAGIAVAAMVLTHTPTTIVFVTLALLYVPCVVVTRPRWGAAVVRMGVAGLLAVGLSAFWWVPVVAHRDLVGLSVPTGPDRSFFADARTLVAGDFIVPGKLVWAMFAGWAYVLWRARSRPRTALALVAVPIAYFAMGYAVAPLMPYQIAWQNKVRGLGYAATLALLPAGAFLAAAGRPLGAVGRFAAIGAAVWLLTASAGPLRAMHIRPYQPAPSCLTQMAHEITTAVEPPARFTTREDAYYQEGSIGMNYTEHGVPRSLFPGIERWLVWTSHRAALTGLTIESSSAPGVAGAAARLGRVTPESSADELVRYGVTHVVAPNPEIAQRLLSSGRFTTVAECAPLSLLRVHPKPGHPDPDAFLDTTRPTRARLTGRDPEHLRIHFETDAAGPATVAVAYSPRWRATLNGRPAEVKNAGDGLLAVDLPGGRGRLDLDYETHPCDRVGRLVTLGTLAVAAAWSWVRMRRRATVSPAPGAAA